MTFTRLQLLMAVTLTCYTSFAFGWLMADNVVMLVSAAGLLTAVVVLSR